MKKIPMLEKFAAQSLVEYDGELIFSKEKFAELIIADIGQIVSGLIVPETWEQDIGPYEHWNRALGTVALEIEQHFYGEAE